MSDSFQVTVGPQGRILLPAKIRRAAGMEPGTNLVARLEGECVVLIPREAVKHRLWEMFSNDEGSMAEELLAERRIEAARALQRSDD